MKDINSEHDHRHSYDVDDDDDDDDDDHVSDEITKTTIKVFFHFYLQRVRMFWTNTAAA